ncbi:MAG: carboxyltransferase domain-containing protein [Saprospiraceae bacterium]|nr:carboxyltransferase domain-containing protein [Saprospiraceae bacterium]
MKLLQLDQIKYEIRQYGNEFLILKNDSCGAVCNSLIGKSILDKKLPFIKEVIASEEEILIALSETELIDLNALTGISVKANQESKQWTIPLLIDNNGDWSHIASRTGFNQDAYIQAFLQSKLTMQMAGFLPGFPYLKGLDKALYCPRKETPSISVRAGSIAVGGPYVGIYPVDSPGGWNVIGVTPLHIINADHIPPGFINPGDIIKFKLIDKPEYHVLKNKGLSLNDYNFS